MNKQKKLTQLVVKQGKISAVIVLVFLGIYFATDYVLSRAEEEHSKADQSLAQEQALATSLSNQIEKSGFAEKHFLETQRYRTNMDYSNNTEGMKSWLKSAIGRYRLASTFKLSLTTAKPLENNELSGSKYELVQHEGMRVDFSAISDTHVYSFIEEMAAAAPGLIVIDSLNLTRMGEVDKARISDLRRGTEVYLVSGQMRFNWIGVNEKTNKNSAFAAPAAGGAQ